MTREKIPTIFIFEKVVGFFLECSESLSLMTLGVQLYFFLHIAGWAEMFPRHIPATDWGQAFLFSAFIPDAW